MVYYYRTDISEGTEVNKTSARNECIIYHYWYFLDERFTFETITCNNCHDVLMMSIGIKGPSTKTSVTLSRGAGQAGFC